MDGDATLAALELDESFEVERVLAEGPAGATELVRDAGGTRLVRKRIPAELANRRAWEALAGADDPRLPRVRLVYELPDQLVVVSDWVEGASVRDLVSSAGPMPEQVACRIACEVAGAVQALHDRGVVHRDVTPANVVCSHGSVRLIDLGIARVGGTRARHDTTPLGTWGYAAPEQFGFAQTDARSDVYSIGRLLAYMLTGVEPGGDALEEALDDPRRVRPALRDVIRRACAFEPGGRPATAALLAQEIAAAVPAPAPPPSPAPRPAAPTPWAEPLSPRALAEGWRREDGARRVAAVVLGSVGAFWVAIFLGVVALAVRTFRPAAVEVLTLLVCLELLALVACATLEATAVALRCGPYACAGPPWGRLAARLGVMAGALILVTAVAMALAVALFGTGVEAG